MRKQWEEGERGFINGDIKSFWKGEEYYEGPYWQWVGYTEPREENWRDKSWDDYIGLQV
jgi:hypothetical protein